MTQDWRPLKAPSRPRIPASGPPSTERGTFSVGPFVRLSRVHALSSAGDAMVTVALAGSLFFSIDPSAARWRVGLYLALTIAPFALVSPLIGPAIDRASGGRRMMVIIINAARAVVAGLMITNLDNLLLFPLAFAILVLQKSYAIAKAAIVPTVCKTHDELVEKNSKLALLSGVAGFAGAAPAALAQLVGGPGWSVFLAAVTFAAACVFSVRIPKTAVASEPETAPERAELRSGGIVLAASAMGMLRAAIGFFTFLVAFAYRGGTDDLDLSGSGSVLGSKLHEAFLDADLGAGGTSPLKLGAVVGFSVLGGLAGSLAAPHLRRVVSEEKMLLGALAVVSATSLLGTWSGGLSGALMVGAGVGLGVSAGKLAFDSLVQRDAPDANYGRTFARFETRFQLLWVLGALVPVVFTLPARFGFFMLAIGAGFAGTSYLLGSRSITTNGDGTPLRTEPPVPQPIEQGTGTPRASVSPDDPTLDQRPQRDPGLDATRELDLRSDEDQPRLF